MIIADSTNNVSLGSYADVYKEHDRGVLRVYLYEDLPLDMVVDLQNSIPGTVRYDNRILVIEVQGGNTLGLIVSKIEDLPVVGWQLLSDDKRLSVWPLAILFGLLVLWRKK